MKAGVDAIVIDTAHGHSQGVIDAVRMAKKNFPGIELIAGNIATADAAEALIKAGVDAIKVGIGPGSICTTRVVAGIGVPQITAIADCAKVARKHGVSLIADGGIKFSGDITKAVAAGADVIMVGSLFAGTEESPGDTILYQGRATRAIVAWAPSVHEGREQGPLLSERCGQRGQAGAGGNRGHGSPARTAFGQHPPVDGWAAGRNGYTGCKTVKELQQNGRFVRITGAGLKESHVHDVMITKEAPNYRIEK